jgi:hypothetical protein
MDPHVKAIVFNIGGQIFDHAVNRLLNGGRNPVEERIAQIDRAIEALPADTGELIKIPSSGAETPQNAPESQSPMFTTIGETPYAAAQVEQGAVPPTTPPSNTKAQEIATGCIPCVPPSCLILCNPGVAQINEVKRGEKVVDHQGHYSIVINTMVRDYDGELVEITLPSTNIPLTLTPEHPVLVIEATWCRSRNTLGIPTENWHCQECSGKGYAPRFIPAGELSSKAKHGVFSKHVLLMPRLRGKYDINALDIYSVAQIDPGLMRKQVNRSIQVTPGFLKLVGYYLAEGSVQLQRRGALVRFDFGPMETNLANETVSLLHEIFGVEASIEAMPSSQRVSISSLVLGHFFINLFGTGAKNKHLPQWVLLLPPEKQVRLIEGYWLGDGSYGMSYNRRVMSATTTSKQLAYALRIVLHRLGVLHHLGHRKTRPSFIGARAIKAGSDQWEIQLNSNATHKLHSLINGEDPGFQFVQSSQTGLDDAYVYLPVKNVGRIPYKGPVFNLETDTGTYCANGVIVHNCAIGHLGTCSGLLNEAMRFARKDGVSSEEVIDRVNMCLDELNAMERVDLRPELIINLVPSQKELADTVLVHSRNTRHALENLGDTDHLEKTAGELQRVRQQVGRAWFHERSKEIDKASSEPAEEEILTLDEAKKMASEQAAKEVDELWHSQEKI